MKYKHKFYFAEGRINGIIRGFLFDSVKNIAILNKGTSAETIIQNADKLPDFRILEESE